MRERWQQQQQQAERPSIGRRGHLQRSFAEVIRSGDAARGCLGVATMPEELLLRRFQWLKRCARVAPVDGRVDAAKIQQLLNKGPRWREVGWSHRWVKGTSRWWQGPKKRQKGWFKATT